MIFKYFKKSRKDFGFKPNLIESSSYLRKFKEKCIIIPFGVDLRKFENFSEKEIRKIKEKCGEFILFVGRLNYYKRLKYLIEAIKDIEVNLLIIGEGQLKENLQISKLMIKYFLHHQPENKLVNYYKACKVFVLPSIFKSEAFGLVLIEAMACGKSVISTELETRTSFVNQNGVTGFVVPPRNSQFLSQIIKKVLEDEKLAEEFGKNALKRVKEKFSLEKMLKEIKKVYLEIFKKD